MNNKILEFIENAGISLFITLALLLSMTVVGVLCYGVLQIFVKIPIPAVVFVAVWATVYILYVRGYFRE